MTHSKENDTLGEKQYWKRTALQKANCVYPIFTAHTRSFREGNIFSRVCLFVYLATGGPGDHYLCNPPLPYGDPGPPLPHHMDLFKLVYLWPLPLLKTCSGAYVYWQAGSWSSTEKLSCVLLIHLIRWIRSTKLEPVKHDWRLLKAFLCLAPLYL